MSGLIFFSYHCMTIAAISARYEEEENIKLNRQHDPTYKPSVEKTAIIFGGTQADLEMMFNKVPIGGGLIFLIGLIDLPFSFCLDIVLLPVTIPWEITSSI